MLSHLPEKTREKIYLSLIAVIGLLRFVNLGFLDLQAWDEALYAVRSEGILRYGNVVDQTPHAIDGLYSSLHPPLYVWLTALSYRFLGISEFSSRCASAFLGGLTLFVIYRIGKKLANADIGFFAAFLYGLNPFVSFYARQGQFDTTLVFFLTLSVYYMIDATPEYETRGFIRAGISTGAALMSKLFVGLGIPLVYAISIFFTKREEQSREWKLFTSLVLILFLVAAPWHLYMTIVHGHGNPFFFLTGSAMWERTVSGVEGNVKPLEVLYFVNQLFVLSPVCVFWFLYGLWNVIQHRERGWLLLAIWFLTFFFVFSLIRTKLAVYLLPMLVPASLIAAREINRATDGEIPPRDLSILLGGTVISVLWGASQVWRNSIKEALQQLAGLHLPQAETFLKLLPFLLSASAVLLLLVAFYRSGQVDRLRQPLAYIMFIPLFCWGAYQIVYVDRVQWNDGGKELAGFIQEHGIERILVAGYERNPQLTYYLRGADIGWREDVVFRRIIPPKNRVEFRTWLMAETAQEPYSSLLIIEKDKLIRYEIIEPSTIVPPDFHLVFDSRRYACFQREKLVHLASQVQ